jgi:hypothetical protein
VIKIVPQTGDVFWGEYALGVHLTHDAFSLQNPLLVPLSFPHMAMLGVIRADYDLPTQTIDKYPCILKVSFQNQQINFISIDHPETDYEDGEEEEWVHSQLKWIISVRKLVRDQLGEPHRIRNADLLDEAETLPPEFVKELQEWSYVFDWGKVVFWHDYLRWTDQISIFYGMFTQISTWDALIEECERRIENTRIFNLRKLGYITEIRHLIDLVRHDFDFQMVKPVLGDDGIGFHYGAGRKWVMLKIYPERVNKKYTIGRSDSIYQADVDEINLIKTLRLFIESEKLP